MFKFYYDKEKKNSDKALVRAETSKAHDGKIQIQAEGSLGDECYLVAELIVALIKEGKSDKEKDAILDRIFDSVDYIRERRNV